MQAIALVTARAGGPWLGFVLASPDSYSRRRIRTRAAGALGLPEAERASAIFAAKPPIPADF